MDSLTEIKNIIEEADMVLVGIGEEFSIDPSELVKRTELETLEREEMEFVMDSLYLEELEKKDNPEIRSRLKSYHELQELLENKNYYIVTICSDDVITVSDLKQDRIVKPCGTRYLLQCSKGCTDEVIDSEKFRKEITDCFKEGFSEEFIHEHVPVCEHCHAFMQSNLVTREHYLEKGYMDDWKRYTMWLQGTLNKKICILELGVSFRYPTVIRWPFEKIAVLNHKAKFIRVNKDMPQAAKEIADKSVSIRQDSRDFLAELIK